ncbi:MAG: hypothetical protein KJO62_03910, partial [Gammaproteobacteria bacterium]|nr:hypothetical protein [Gammaproteobacteria bacterium]
MQAFQRYFVSFVPGFRRSPAAIVFALNLAVLVTASLGSPLLRATNADNAGADGEYEWQLKLSEQNVKTSVRKRADTALLEARHVAETSAGLDQVLAQLGDGTSCITWMQRCKSAKIIKREDENSFLGYVVLNMPWPISNRDLVYRSSRSRGADNSVVIEQRAAPDDHPAGKLVRMISNNRFELTALDSGGTRISWRVFSDPRGNVSANMINGRMYKETR